MYAYCPLFFRQKTKQVDKDTTAETVKGNYQRNFTLLKLLRIILCPKIPNSAEVLLGHRNHLLQLVLSVVVCYQFKALFENYKENSFKI